MRILFVHNQLGFHGGAEANIYQTATALRERGHAIAILHGKATGQGDVAWLNAFELLVPLAGKDYPATTRRTIQIFEPDLIYVHKMDKLPVVETLVESGIPLARMVHDHDLYCMRSYKYNPLTRAVCQRAASAYCVFPCGATVARKRGGGFPLKWVSYRAKQEEIALNRRFDRMLVFSRYMREELVRNGFPPDKIEVHSPLHAERTEPPPSTFDASNLILSVGQIIRGKGVDVLLESLARVKTKYECAILGDGRHRRHCEALSDRLGLSDRVRFPGFVLPHELMHYYRRCSVAAVSSVWPEPFGMVGPDAMRYGLPVVAFDVGGIREWLHDGENGFLVPWMDRAQFAERIQQLLTDKALARKMGERGRQILKEKFVPAKQVQALERSFADLIRTKPQRVRTQTPEKVSPIPGLNLAGSRPTAQAA
jgi:glycosyltransferase involved in cell wall biosynthesis